MITITAGMPATLNYELFAADGSAMADIDVATLSYSVYDVTNDAEVRASTSITAVASGSVSLVAADTQINGTGSRERRRVCLLVNDTDLWCGMEFDVVTSCCEPSA